MSVVHQRPAATVTISTTVVLAVILIVVIALVIIFLYRNSRGPFRRSPVSANNLSTDLPTSGPASYFQPKLPKQPDSPSRPQREPQYPPMSSELHKTPHRNYERPVLVTANSKTSVQGSATRGSTRTTQPLPGTSSMVTMFKVPSSEPVRPLHPTPSKSPPVRKATPTKANGVSYPPQTAYFIPSSTATAAKTRTASNTPSPPPQQPHSAIRTPTSASTLRNPTSSSTLRAPVSTFNPQNHTLRSPPSDRDIQPPPQAYQSHPALRHPASSPSLPRTRTTDIPPTMHQPLPFPLTTDTTDLSTDIADPTEHANLGYKNTTTRQNIPSNQPTHPSPPFQLQPQSQPLTNKPSRPLVNSTYANFLTTRMQTHSSSLLLHPNPASLAALLVGSEAGTTDASSGDGGGWPDTNTNDRDGIQERIQHTGLATVGDVAATTNAAATTEGRFYDNPRSRSRRGGDLARERSVEERYRRFRDTGAFADDGGAGARGSKGDDDPVGRPWGRFGGDIERGREGGDDGGGGGGGNGILPLRLPSKNKGF